VTAGLAIVSVVTAQSLISQSEWQLAVAVGWPVAVAWCAPVALGGYVLAAMLAQKGLRGAVATSAVSVVMSHGVYAADPVWASGTAGVGRLWWPLAAGCSVVPLLVMYRVHGLIERARRRTGPGRTGVPRPVSSPVPPVVHRPVSSVRQRPASQVAILGVLQGHPEGRVKWAEVLLGTGLAKSTAVKAMSRLMAEGLVVKVSEGIYQRKAAAS
jgi:hypothetical protein